MASDGTRFLGYEGRGLAQSEEKIEVWNGCDIISTRIFYRFVTDHNNVD